PMESYKKHADEIVKLKHDKEALETKNKSLQASVARENKRFEELKQANDDLQEELRIREIERKRREKEREKERADLDKKHAYIEKQKQKIIVANQELDAKRAKIDRAYVLLGKLYGVLGYHYTANGKNVNYKVAKGELVPRKFNKSGFPLLFEMIRIS
ncbi:hypothetical protein, partial [Streptomyces xinghaiensis]|uniref:hypothetical protein n=4 Tax=Bacteria TaxID=2 RepID=UPI00160CF234